MLPVATHRKWAREYLTRAQNAQKRQDQVRLLQMAVSNCVRAQEIESHPPDDDMDRRSAEVGAPKPG
jgi:hypothetical protein